MANVPGQRRLPGVASGAGRPRQSTVARVRRGVDSQLTAQRATHQLERADDGMVALARTLADAIDAEVTDPDGSRYTVGHLAAKLSPILMALRGERLDRGDGAGADAELAALIAALRDTPRP